MFWVSLEVQSYIFSNNFHDFIIYKIFFSQTKWLLNINLKHKFPNSNAFTLGFTLYTFMLRDTSWQQRHLMSSSLTNHISSCPYSTLYVRKFPFISTNQRIKEWLVVTPTAQFPKGNMSGYIANSCQSISKMTWSIYLFGWCNITKLRSTYQCELSNVLEHPIRIDRLINVIFKKKIRNS